MNSQSYSSRADIEVAELALRAVLVDEFRKEARSDAQSLDRMLAHLVNMNLFLSTSPEILDNVKKRLGDFAAAATRMADRNPDSGPQLKVAAEKLQQASERLNGASAVQ